MASMSVQKIFKNVFCFFFFLFLFFFFFFLFCVFLFLFLFLFPGVSAQLCLLRCVGIVELAKDGHGVFTVQGP